MAHELSIREAWRNSEIERMAEALDEDPEDLPANYPNYITADDGDHDPWAVEGWDGRELSEAEQWETAINGPLESGYDRPLQLAEDMDLQDAVDERDAEIASLRAQNAELAHRADPDRRQRMANKRAELEYRVASNLSGHVDYTVGVEQQRDQLAQAHEDLLVNYSLDIAHRNYGERFEDAYRAVTRMNKHDPVARAIVQKIYTSPNQGEALMAWYESRGSHPGNSAQRRRLPPSLSSGERSSAYRGRRAPERSSSSPSRWPVGADAEAIGADPAEERDIMAYALG